MLDDKARAARRSKVRKMIGCSFFLGILLIIAFDAALFSTDDTITISATFREYFGEQARAFWAMLLGMIVGIAIVIWTGWGLRPGLTIWGAVKWWGGCLFVLGGAGIVGFDFFWYCWGQPSIFRWITSDVGMARASLYSSVVAALGVHFIGWSVKGKQS